LIDRYTRPAMGRIWTEEHKYQCWLKVEVEASKVLAEDGVIPAAAAIISAIEDALSLFNVRIAQMPVTPPKLVELIAQGATR